MHSTHDVFYCVAFQILAGMCVPAASGSSECTGSPRGTRISITTHVVITCMAFTISSFVCCLPDPTRRVYPRLLLALGLLAAYEELMVLMMFYFVCNFSDPTQCVAVPIATASSGSVGGPRGAGGIRVLFCVLLFRSYRAIQYPSPLSALGL